MNREIVFKIKKCKLQLLWALLALIFFLSAPKKEKEFKSALLNPKYKVDEIELIQRNSQKLLLKKTGSFWLGETEIEGKDKLYFSCQNELVQKLLFNLSGITSFYEMSSGNKNLQKYGLAKEDSFTLKLSQNDSVVSAITFGSLDSRHRIFFCVQNQEKIFAAPSSPFEPYLNVNVDFWASPEIFPKEIVGADLKYRRGRVAYAKGLDWSKALEKVYDAKDGNIYKALFIPRNDSSDDYYCAFFAQPAAQRSQEEKDALKKINLLSIVSRWTLQRLLDEEY